MELVENGFMSGLDAIQVRNNAKQLMGFSKQWNAGDTLRAFYPIGWDKNGKPQLAVGALWAHAINDAKALGLQAITIPSTCKFDRYGTLLTEPDITYQFSKIAPAFLEGQHQLEIAEIENKTWPDNATQRTAISECDMKYSKDAKNPIRPIIGTAKYNIYVEVASVKLVNDVPDTKTFAVSTQSVSNQLMNELYMILEDKKYKLKPGDRFLEVEWQYPVNSNKSESGRLAKPNGIATEYKLETQFPEQFKLMQPFLDQLSMDPEAIQHHAVKSLDMQRVRGALAKFAYRNSACLDILEGDAYDVLIRNAQAVEALDFRWAIKNEKLLGDIDKKLAELKAKDEDIDAIKRQAMAESESVEKPVTQEEIAEAPKFSDILGEEAMQEEFVPEAKTISPDIVDLMNGPMRERDDIGDDITMPVLP